MHSHEVLAVGSNPVTECGYSIINLVKELLHIFMRKKNSQYASVENDFSLATPLVTQISKILK